MARALRTSAPPPEKDATMQTIAFATGLGSDEQPAVATAAALAAATGAKLFTVHASTGAPPGAMPRADETAAKWGHRIDNELMVHSCCDDPADTLLDALRRIAPELVVMGTHGRSGLAQIFNESVAESVARNVKVPTLFVPLHGDGLASETGAVNLQRLVVPAGDAVATKAGLEAAAWLARTSGSTDVEVVLLHVEDGTPMPALDTLPEGLRVTRRTAKGKVEDAIVDLAVGYDACAVVMATRGHNGLVDALTGSHTEHVVRKVRCPVLSVPLPD